MADKLKQSWIEWAYEGQKPGYQPFKVEHRYGAWPKQVQFHEATERFIVYGGARGPGKTRALVEDGLATMVRWPGIPIWFLRKDLKDLKATTEVEWQKICPPELYDPRYGGQYHKGERWYEFPNGSIARFGELKDWESYKSATVGRFYIDELNEIEEDALTNLAPALRWTTEKGICKRPECAALGEEFAREHPEHPRYQIKCATNPAPGWVKTRFWEPWRNGHERPNHKFISATAYDNPSLPPNFIPDLLQTNTATWVQNYVHGDWSAFENMVWPHINRPTHMWRGPIPFDQFVEIIGGIDYGGTTTEAHRTCAYLTGRTRSGRRITFWEYSKQGAAAEDFFTTITVKQREFHPLRWEADASQPRANELLRGNGIPVFDAPRYKGAVKDGVNEVYRQTQLGPTGEPGLWIAETCPRLWSGIETYQLDPETGEPAKNQDDDEVNAWRYNIMAAVREWGGGERLTIRSKSNSDRVASKPSRLVQQFKEERRARIRKFIEANPDA